MDDNEVFNAPLMGKNHIDPSMLHLILEDANQKDFITFVHDVYLEYIRQCMKDDRLTFSLTALLAFTALYSNKTLRERNQYRYIVVDEFQDTNSLQMMTTLMLLKEPNLCVVGDWKQGIYGFRFAEITNITEFSSKVRAFESFLNYDDDRIISLPTPIQLELTHNYRSSQTIIDASFMAMRAPGSSKEKDIPFNGTALTAAHEFITNDDSHVRYVLAPDTESEPRCVLNAIRDYVLDEKYMIIDKKGNKHRAGYGDIAILCRTNNQCRLILQELMDADIPAFLQGDVQIMDTHEGKLALAWLKFINNRNDPWGYLPILADMGVDSGRYYPSELVRIKKAGPDAIPRFLDEIRNGLCDKKQRIGHLLCSIFDLYGLDNDITQSIINNMTTLHNTSMMTISDIISIMERDIEKNASYSIENPIDNNAVRIMSMHKSKGLEFPIVITPFIDTNSMPKSDKGDEEFYFNEVYGLRSKKEIGNFQLGDGNVYKKVCTNWKTKLARKCISKNYDEERRLLFVTLSRASQYITVIASATKTSAMFKYISDGKTDNIPEHPETIATTDACTDDRPTFTGTRRKISVEGVHDYMAHEIDTEVRGLGKAHGNRVHRIAQDLFHGKPIDDEDWGLDETIVLDDFIQSLKGYTDARSELDCYLPIPDMDLTLHGVIDLFVEYEDHIEVHDYKTDLSDINEGQYRFQLSVYAQSISACRKDKPVKCFIRYVSMDPDRVIEFEPMDMDDITAHVHSNGQEGQNGLSGE